MDNQKTPLILLTIGGVAIIGLAAMMFLKKPQEAKMTPPTNTETAQTTQPAASASPEGATAETMEGKTNTSTVRTIEIEAGSFYYKPNTLTVKKGETIKLVFKSVDMMHDLNIDELGIKVPVTKGGETAEFEFTVNTAGTFEYYCSVGQHRKMGQVGTITVTE